MNDKWKQVIWTVIVKLVLIACFVWLPPIKAASETEGAISGTVSDTVGKPLRGATITVTLDNASVSRFSDAEGKYRISGLKSGDYRVSVTAYGYTIKTANVKIESSVASAMDFSLNQNWNPGLISTAEYISAFGDDNDMRSLEATCTGCHNFSWIMRRKGQTAAEWEDFIPRMSPRKLFITPRFSPEQLKNVSILLEKYFGPDSPLPTEQQVHHVPMSDEALRSTIRMYSPPTRNISHSLHVGQNGQIWFTEFDNYSNKLASFDPRENKFQEFELPTPQAGPHNPWVARTGIVWVTEANVHKLAALDPETGKFTEYTPPLGAGTHTLREDLHGNIWASGSKITKFDIDTKQFTVFDTPETYDISVDSKGNVWGCTPVGFQVPYPAKAGGTIVRIDSKTSLITKYQVPGATSIRGIEVDAQDNVWFGDVMGHRLGRIDYKTGQMRFYQPPTKDFSSYGIVVDKKSGYIWVADYLGANVIRLDPSTGKFTEFPFPSRVQMIRFFGEDPKGQIWFTDFSTGRIGVLETGETNMPFVR